MMTSLIQVALGGAIGASCRYLTNVGAMRLLGGGFPYGTVVVNILGSFLMGVLVVAFAHRGGNQFAPLIMTGVLGGFTTFSAFSLDAVNLYQRGDILLAATYVFGSVAVGIAALIVGMAIARGVLS
ncbi:fluoride efflux transporter CrcB [Marivivens sp. LCG002]|uniref:fluoride efflux transporter CrcB n=1 Tax=Marivivens sp. LCG002 TaxID=3051171 RepID=UPI002556563C|nr:fluoride efflux transporter CrcB [Marivivens sp. LCG002]WIV51109.1 fluoride efflux transporter CrcB [Marivivens sp. LCG002]